MTEHNRNPAISCLHYKEQVRLYLMAQKTNFTVQYESICEPHFPYKRITRIRQARQTHVQCEK